MDIFPTLAFKIIKAQELIIGPIAWMEAAKVTGLQVNRVQQSLQLSGDNKKIIDGLVKQYARLFGRVSEEVCKEAAKDVLAKLPPTEVPSSLKN